MVYVRLGKRLNIQNVNLLVNNIMPKTSIHPEYYSNAKVYCDGQLVMKVGSTKPVLKVDIWSGTHPFYTGSQKLIDTEGRVERFMRKYGIDDQN
jgi:large subunit ribosomal protein L31